MNRIHLSAALLVGLGSLSTAGAALVTNGNFASPAQSAGGFTNFSPGSTGITNFTATGGTNGGAQLLGTTYGATAGGGGQNFPIVPTAGEQTLQLFVNAPGGVSTQITIPFGETDTISFQLGGRNGAASASVTLDGVSQGTYSSSASTNIGGTGNVGPYKFNSFTTVGTGSVQTLAFNDSSGVPVLQEVAVSPVPEPTAAGLLLLAGVGLLARRKTRKAALDPLGAN